MTKRMSENEMGCQGILFYYCGFVFMVCLLAPHVQGGESLNSILFIYFDTNGTDSID